MKEHGVKMSCGSDPAGLVGVSVILAFVFLSLLTPLGTFAAGPDPAEVKNSQLAGLPLFTLITIGDSLTHGTMDATNNGLNTHNSYVEKVAQALRRVALLRFRQPYFDMDGDRWRPFRIPYNLGVDGADLFSAEGIEYYKRVGAPSSYVNPDYLCDTIPAANLSGDYDRVLYPINLLERRAISQIDAATHHLSGGGQVPAGDLAIVLFWLGNNDSSSSALGFGGENPTFLPLPLDAVEAELDPLLTGLLRFGEWTGDLSFDPYTLEAIERNLTTISDFSAQFDVLVGRLRSQRQVTGREVQMFFLTLPYYTSVGNLFDSDDLEFYLRKIDTDYLVPDSFKRADPFLTLPVNGDRVSLLTFGLMYTLLHSGYSVDHVNRILDTDGVQRDGMVLSEAEQEIIVARIDAFNEIIASAGTSDLHSIDVGKRMNDILTGREPLVVGGKVFSRHWGRGHAFSIDGVHPGYTGHALIANEVIGGIDELLGLGLSPVDLEGVAARDPYVDRDGDGWVTGVDYPVSGIADLLFLFRDPDDGDPGVQNSLPADVWERISAALISMAVTSPAMAKEAEALGLVR
jgi:lysophospholipase L1-like esterase